MAINFKTQNPKPLEPKTQTCKKSFMSNCALTEWQDERDYSPWQDSIDPALGEAMSGGAPAGEEQACRRIESTDTAQITQGKLHLFCTAQMNLSVLRLAFIFIEENARVPPW